MSWRTDVAFFDYWDPPWAVLLGQVGFFDQFTVTMSRLAMVLVVETADAIDRRFEIPPGEESAGEPRFRP